MNEDQERDELPPCGEWQQALRDVAAEAEARGREQGRREAAEELRRRAHEITANWPEDDEVRLAAGLDDLADFLESTGGPE